MFEKPVVILMMVCSWNSVAAHSGLVIFHIFRAEDEAQFMGDAFITGSKCFNDPAQKCLGGTMLFAEGVEIIAKSPELIVQASQELDPLGLWDQVTFKDCLEPVRLGRIAYCPGEPARATCLKHGRKEGYMKHRDVDPFIF